MRQLLFFIIALTVHLSVFGQHDIGLKVNGGMCYFSTKSRSSQQQETQKFFYRPSGQCGFFYNYCFKNKLLIGTEALFMPIEGKEYLKFPLTDEHGNYTGDYSEGNIYRRIFYLGVPVYVGYGFKKFNVNLGVQANIVMASSGEDRGQAIYQGQLYTWHNKSNGLGINRLDCGARIGMLYKLSKTFSIEANYYYGITNLIKNKVLRDYLTWKVQQLTIGVRYKLFSFEGLTRKKRKK